jgi:signal transduction histidine kinase
LDDSSRRHLDMIRTAALKMTGLIDALLKYSRLEQQSLPKSRINLAELVAEVVAARRPVEDSPDAPIFALEVPPIQVWAEPTSLHQALTNLLDNALKFSRHASPSHVGIGATERGDTVTLWVRDNGVGFEAGQAHRLFCLFQRLHADAEYEGTGVGLAIVKLVMDKHDGRVWAESSPGKGAMFFLEWPSRP